MVLINGDPVSMVVTAAVVGIGAGLGSAIGQAIYKAFLEDRVNKFLDKKHREEALQKLKNKIKNIESPEISGAPDTVVDNILGKNGNNN